MGRVRIMAQAAVALAGATGAAAVAAISSLGDPDALGCAYFLPFTPADADLHPTAGRGFNDGDARKGNAA